MISLNSMQIDAFKRHLREREYSRSTIEKYIRDMQVLAVFCGGEIRDKMQLVAYKEHLMNIGYKIASINSMLASINGFLMFSGYADWKMRYIRVQRSLFVRKEKELTRKDYQRLLEKAYDRKDERLALLLQTICATGIRVSELNAVTVESLRHGQATIWCKGKVRQILIPAQLVRMLKAYCRKQRITSGVVFTTKNGRPLDRSNIWKMMKNLAAAAGVKAGKVFPHNLRHLFACTYYAKFKDIVHLADILGHSSINTARIYTMKNEREQIHQMNKLSLIMPICTT